MTSSDFKDLLQNESQFAIEEMHYSPNLNMSDFHFHKHFEILYITSGSRTLYINNSHKFSLDENTIALIRPDTIHKTISETNSGQSRILINISSELSEKISQATSQILFSCFNVYTLPLDRYSKSMLNYLFRELLDNKYAESDFFEIKNQINLEKILLILCEIYNKQNFTDDTTFNPLIQEKVNYVINYFQKKFHTQVSIPDLAEKLNFSQTYLERIFKQATGISPYKYLSSIRVINATRLLQSGTMNVSKIASACGFNNNTSFTRIFKQSTGYSPKQYQTLYKQIEKQTINP